MAPATAGAAPTKGMNLTRKVCIVTGAASGFGEAVSRQLAARGAIVVLADKDAVKGIKVASELDEQYSGELDIGFFPFVETDLSTFAGVKKVFDECIKRFGTVDIVINNAGIGDGDKYFFDEKDPESSGWELMVNVNINAVIYGTQLAINEFKESNKAGIVINTASGAAFTPIPEIPVYAATKAAVMHFTRSIGSLYPKIRVHAVCPGAVLTPLAAASASVPTMHKFNKSPTIASSQKLLSVDDVADALMYCIDNELESGVSVTAFASGLEVIKVETRTVEKIKDVRKRDGRAKL